MKRFPEIHVIERIDAKAEVAKAELVQVTSHLQGRESRVLELEGKIVSIKTELQTEKNMVRALEAELLKERKTINNLLQQMQTIELEARAASEQARLREQIFQKEKEALQKELDEERAMRLQHMYMITRSRAEADNAAKEIDTLNKAILVTKEEQNSSVAQIEALECALRASKRAVDQHEVELDATTAANLSHKTHTHKLRSRLVETEREITIWRKKYESAVVAAANDRSVFGKMVRRSVTKKSNSTYNCRSSAPSHSRMRDNAKSTNAEELKIKHSQKYSFDVPKLSQDSRGLLWPPAV